MTNELQTAVQSLIKLIELSKTSPPDLGELKPIIAKIIAGNELTTEERVLLDAIPDWKELIEDYMNYFEQKLALHEAIENHKFLIRQIFGIPMVDKPTGFQIFTPPISLLYNKVVADKTSDLESESK